MTSPVAVAGTAFSAVGTGLNRRSRRPVAWRGVTWRDSENRQINRPSFAVLALPSAEADRVRLWFRSRRGTHRLANVVHRIRRRKIWPEKTGVERGWSPRLRWVDYGRNVKILRIFTKRWRVYGTRSVADIKRHNFSDKFFCSGFTAILECLTVHHSRTWIIAAQCFFSKNTDFLEYMLKFPQCNGICITRNFLTLSSFDRE